MAGIDVCIILDEIADMLELLGDNPYKIRAYRNATRSLYHLNEDLETIWREGRLKSIPGVGDAIATKIDELFRTGSIQLHRELSDRIPPGVLEMLSIPGLGPRTAAIIFCHTGIDNIKDLVAAAEAKKLRELPGLGAKSEYNIIKGVQLLSGISGKITLGVALPFALEFTDYLKSSQLVTQAEPVGSIRRGKPLVSDIDILAATDNEEAVRGMVREYRRVKEVTHDEPGYIGGYLVLNLPFEIILVPPADFNRALVWCTGSKDHRKRLYDLGLVIDKPGESYPNEAAVYLAGGMQYIPPELRENRGEIEAACQNHLPALIEPENIKGDLHLHTDQSDGADNLAEVISMAEKLNYDYIAITDHSQSLAISRGLTPERLRLQQIDINKRESKTSLKLFKGSEVDILKDGTLDYDAETLQQLDVVIASIHSNFKLERSQQTARLESAMKNPDVDIVGHMTGRLFNRRPGYELDTDYLIKLAARTDTALEINSHPDRLDIGEELLPECRDLGVKVAINSDAHQVQDMALIWYGVKCARRSWLSPEQIINSWATAELEKWLQRNRT